MAITPKNVALQALPTMQWKNIIDFPEHAWSNADKVMFHIFIHILIEKKNTRVG